jgi:hypothetical protein
MVCSKLLALLIRKNNQRNHCQININTKQHIWQNKTTMERNFEPQVHGGSMVVTTKALLAYYWTIKP